MSEEENISIDTLKEVASDDFDTLGDDISPKMAQNILNVIDKQKEKLAILETAELNYYIGYEDGKLHRQTATQQLIENEQIERLTKIIKQQQKEIEEKNIAINKMSKDISRQLEEIEEKSTIIMVGAEKVKQLEKGNRSLMESRIKWKNRYYKEKDKNKKCISKDKIREFIKKELPDDEAIKYYTIWNVNGIDLRKKLEKLLEKN